MAKPKSIQLINVAGERRNARRARRLSRTCWLLSCLMVSALGGCRHIDNAQVDVLESELRKQEDYIYELEEYLMEYSEKLRQARAMQCETAISPKSASNATSSGEPTLDVDAVKRPTLPMNGRNKLAPAAKPSLPAPPATTEAPSAGAAATPPETLEVEPALPAEEINPDEMEAPALEIGPGVQASPFKKTFESAEAPLLIPDPIDYQADDDELAAGSARPNQVEEPNEADPVTAAAPLLAAPQVNSERLSADHLQIRRVFAERPEPDGEAIASLLVVIETLNATDEPVGADGGASLMIMKRDESGAMRRVERWDFTPEETAAAWQSSQLGDGLHLELPLAEAQLPGGELELWARVLAADGRKLLTQIPLEPTQLVSMADFNAEESLAAKEPAAPTPETRLTEPMPTDVSTEDEVAVSAIAKTAAEASKPAWRASSVRLDDARVESFATTAGGPTARVASSSMESTTKPTWKRSATAGAAEAKREWAPFR